MGVAVANVAYTTYNAYQYYSNGRENLAVRGKTALDGIMAGVGFLGPVGFDISATYFVLDVVASTGFSTYTAVSNGADNTSTWIGVGVAVGGAALTVFGSPVIVTAAAVGGVAWGIGQIFYANEINGSIDSNFGYR